MIRWVFCLDIVLFACLCLSCMFFQILFSLFRLREELNRSNEQMEEYRQIISYFNEKNLEHLNAIDSDEDDDNNNNNNNNDDDSRPIEQNFCLDDHTENPMIFLYSKPPLPPDDHHLSILSHLQNEIEFCFFCHIILS